MKKIWRWFIIICILFLILGLLIVIAAFGLNIKFMLHDELEPKIQPLHLEINSEHNKSVVLRYNIEIDNFKNCEAVCNFTFEDVSENKILDFFSQKFEHKGSLEKDFTVQLPEKGEGVKIYMLRSECNNIKSFLCQTKETIRHQSSLSIVRYGLPAKELQIKLESNEKINSLINYLSDSGKMMSETMILANRMHDGISEKTDINEQLEKAVKSYRELVNKRDKAIQEWNDENYLAINTAELTFDNSTSELLNLLKKKIENLSELRNEDIFNIKQAYDMQDILKSSNDTQLSKLIDRFDSFYLLIDRNQRMKEASLNRDIKDRLLQLEKIKKDIAVSIGFGLSIQQATEYYTNTTISKNLSCSKIRELTFKMQLSNQSFIIGPEVQDALRESNITANISQIIGQELPNLDKIFIENYCERRDSNDVNDSIFFKRAFNLKSINLTVESSRPVSQELALNPSVCCYKNQCEECCANCSKTPILILHGHMVDNSQQPVFMMAFFKNIQNKLEDEGYVNAGELDFSGNYSLKLNQPITITSSYYYNSYYSLGRLSLSVDNSENIENYALRLKEIIDLLKKKTGSKKVTIIAHSMGGLVARHYANLFGYEDIDKLILVNTPNHGITKSIFGFCKAMGSAKECEDMTEGSIFLQKLNSNPVPEDAKVYAIRTNGCLMSNGVTGDGIVTDTSAFLEAAENFQVNISCTDIIKDDLHNKVLDPDSHQEVLDIIKDILRN